MSYVALPEESDAPAGAAAVPAVPLAVERAALVEADPAAEPGAEPSREAGAAEAEAVDDAAESATLLDAAPEADPGASGAGEEAGAPEDPETAKKAEIAPLETTKPKRSPKRPSLLQTRARARSQDQDDDDDEQPSDPTVDLVRTRIGEAWTVLDATGDGLIHIDQAFDCFLAMSPSRLDEHAFYQTFLSVSGESEYLDRTVQLLTLFHRCAVFLPNDRHVHDRMARFLKQRAPLSVPRFNWHTFWKTLGAWALLPLSVPFLLLLARLRDRGLCLHGRFSDPEERRLREGIVAFCFSGNSTLSPRASEPLSPDPDPDAELEHRRSVVMTSAAAHRRLRRADTSDGASWDQHASTRRLALDLEEKRHDAAAVQRRMSVDSLPIPMGSGLDRPAAVAIAASKKQRARLLFVVPHLCCVIPLAYHAAHCRGSGARSLDAMSEMLLPLCVLLAVTVVYAARQALSFYSTHVALASLKQTLWRMQFADLVCARKLSTRNVDEPRRYPRGDAAQLTLMDIFGWLYNHRQAAGTWATRAMAVCLVLGSLWNALIPVVYHRHLARAPKTQLAEFCDYEQAHWESIAWLFVAADAVCIGAYSLRFNLWLYDGLRYFHSSVAVVEAFAGVCDARTQVAKPITALKSFDGGRVHQRVEFRGWALDLNHANNVFSWLSLRRALHQRVRSSASMLEWETTVAAVFFVTLWTGVLVASELILGTFEWNQPQLAAVTLTLAFSVFLMWVCYAGARMNDIQSDDELMLRQHQVDLLRLLNHDKETRLRHPTEANEFLDDHIETLQLAETALDRIANTVRASDISWRLLGVELSMSKLHAGVGIVCYLCYLYASSQLQLEIPF